MSRQSLMAGSPDSELRSMLVPIYLWHRYEVCMCAATLDASYIISCSTSRACGK